MCGLHVESSFSPGEILYETFPGGAAFGWVIREPLEAAKLLADDGGRGPEGYLRKLGGGLGFKYFPFSSLQVLEEDFQFGQYCSDGLKPPTSKDSKLCSTRSNDHLQLTAVDGLEIPSPTTERMYKTL